MTAKPQASSEDTWTTVSEGSRTRITFDETGDEFTGIYQGAETIVNPETDEDMHYLNFKAVKVAEFPAANPDIPDGERCAISRSYGLDKAFQDIPVGHLVYMRLFKVVPARKGNPYKDYIVRHRAA